MSNDVTGLEKLKSVNCARLLKLIEFGTVLLIRNRCKLTGLLMISEVAPPISSRCKSGTVLISIVGIGLLSHNTWSRLIRLVISNDVSKLLPQNMAFRLLDGKRFILVS